MKLPFVVFIFVSIVFFQVGIDVALASNRVPFLVNPQSLEGPRYITDATITATSLVAIVMLRNSRLFVFSVAKRDVDTHTNFCNMDPISDSDDDSEDEEVVVLLSLALYEYYSIVVGLNFDFVLLNLTKHSSYLVYNATLFFSSVVQKQYRKKYGHDQLIPVAANDVAFSMHAVLLTAFTLFQIAIYDRGNQKVSKTCIAIVSVACTLQVVMTTIKYIPQAVMNFRRKSTIGFSIGNILLDLLGGVASYGQMAVQSIDQSVSIFFDLLFIVQHYVLYPAKKTALSPDPNTVSQEPLLKSSDGPEKEKV
ncbi:hypothetical protein RHGRI_028149 [Rhododendron griersonianum]|uniref:PQ-loop repeat family protein n=1 Tax=Rhododendron griersonianum TaxID=479676 RepID=A0AAV6IK85_9ERIC|nr:hypothetical protein RHGRI_028149 [Rhododendron griersonianum]